MKFNALAITLLPAALALPTTSGSHDAKIAHRQSAESITDELLFSITLPMFTTRRNARDPSTLDWSSDGCTSSPDNPFGFPFTPACNRHDFGYNNYRDQGRFTESGKAKIDTNFKDEYVPPFLPPLLFIFILDTAVAYTHCHQKPLLPMQVRDRQGRLRSPGRGLLRRREGIRRR